MYVLKRDMRVGGISRARVCTEGLYITVLMCVCRAKSRVTKRH
jgi:hypothetical protein